MVSFIGGRKRFIMAVSFIGGRKLEYLAKITDLCIRIQILLISVLIHVMHHMYCLQCLFFEVTITSFFFSYP